jgi:hypothetical protein
VPANVKSAYVSIAGGGAGGGGGVPYMVSGSSGGYLLSYPLNLTPGESIPITIGFGGIENQDGGTTYFGSYLSCSGGYVRLGDGWAGGDCGVNGGKGVSAVFLGIGGNLAVDYGGVLLGGKSPLSYGSGGDSRRCWGCGPSSLSMGMSGIQGVVIIDVLY